MKELPRPDIYEREFKYMPCGDIMERALGLVEKEAPEKGTVLDLMCGPGYLLGQIAKRRKDLILEGVDISEEFILHARNKYPNIRFHLADVIMWAPQDKYDCCICTGGIHHLPYDKQPGVIEKASNLLKPRGFAIFADPYIGDYTNESERRLKAANLGHEYLVATMRKGAPDDVVKAAIDILYNDVMGFEFKTSLKKISPSFQRAFPHVEVRKTWPEGESEYGDHLIICRKC